MPTRVRLVFALCGATLVLGFGAQAGVAIKVNMGNGGVRMTWFALRFQNGAVEVVCPVTLEATYAVSIRKVAGSLIGNVTSASVGTCTGGSVTFLSTPWSLRYSAYWGTLPNITELLLHISDVGINVRDTVFGVPVACLYLASTSEPLSLFFLREARGRVSFVTPPELGTGPIRYSSGSGASCPSLIYTGGSGTLGIASIPGSFTAVEMYLSAI
jgi:hypothetical protein